MPEDSREQAVLLAPNHKGCIQVALKKACIDE